MLGCGNTVPTSGICANTGPHSIGIGGILAANAADIDDPEDSDGEISKIDFRGVNLRSKKKRDVSGNQNGDKIGDGDANGDGAGCCDNSQQQPERPMSWEGELSDQEMSSNTITNQVGFIGYDILKSSTKRFRGGTFDMFAKISAEEIELFPRKDDEVIVQTYNKDIMSNIYTKIIFILRYI